MTKKTEYRAAVNEYFHVYNRGVRRSNIFDSQENYSFFVSRVRDAYVCSEIRILCFCLMPNHFHFLLRQDAPEGVARFMQKVGNSYAKALNKQRGITGHVLESKYKIKLVDSDEYLIWLSWYIHRNPKEAALVKRCDEWAFSSFPDYVSTRRFDFIGPDVILSQFRSPSEYRRYVEDEGESRPAGVDKFLFIE